MPSTFLDTAASSAITGGITPEVKKSIRDVRMSQIYLLLLRNHTLDRESDDEKRQRRSQDDNDPKNVFRYQRTDSAYKAKKKRPTTTEWPTEGTVKLAIQPLCPRASRSEAKLCARQQKV
jgi:hypothetical protein